MIVNYYISNNEDNLLVLLLVYLNLLEIVVMGIKNLNKYLRTL